MYPMFIQPGTYIVDMGDEAQTLSNPGEEEFYKRVEQECPEHDPDRDGVDPIHSSMYELPDDAVAAVRSVCTLCGETLAEWDEKWKMTKATRVSRIGECPVCESTNWVGGDHGGTGVYRAGEVWHEDCRLKEVYGFEETNGDAPVASNPKEPFTLHRTVTTEINGDAFVWDEYEYTGYFSDHGRYNLPTRDELSEAQLETLREWATGENPTGDDLQDPEDPQEGEFPARFVLLGGFDSDTPSKWICPDCGEVVRPKKDRRIGLETKCIECGSDRWLTAGQPISESAEGSLAALSGREKQVVKLSMLNTADRDIADSLGIEQSTVREYRERAKSKAKRGKELYDFLTASGILAEQ